MLFCHPEKIYLCMQLFLSIYFIYFQTKMSINESFNKLDLSGKLIIKVKKNVF